MQTRETLEISVGRAELALVLNGKSSQMSVCRQIAGGAKPLQKLKDDRGVASARRQNDHLGLGQPSPPRLWA
jgi:hypothetical protein